jgi:predicted DNA-binding transcriptional regulator YafY
VLYLVCTLFELSELRLLVVHRMSQAELTDAPLHAPKDFDLDAYIASGEFDVSSGQLIRLRAILHKNAAQYLAETALSKDQRLRELQDGRVQITASVMHTAQLRRWLLSFGEQVEVLAPESLRHDLKNAAQGMLEHYQHPANRFAQ